MVRTLPFSGTLILAILLGYMVGRIVSVHFAVAEVPPLTLRQEERPEVAVVRIAGINDGRLEGFLRGDVRLFLGEEQVLPEDDGTFAVEPGVLLESDVSVLMPERAQFVASKRGKKYYPVFSPGGERLIPENRVYFETAEEAEEAGYRR